LYSNLRFVISASVVGCAGLIGVLALLPATLEERLLASAELSAPAARPCKQQNWLNLDRNLPHATRNAVGGGSACPGRGGSSRFCRNSGRAAFDRDAVPRRSGTGDGAAKPSHRVSAGGRLTSHSSGKRNRSAAAAGGNGPAADGNRATAGASSAPAGAGIAAAPQQEPVAPQQAAATPQPEEPAPQQEASAPAVPAEPQHTTKRRSVTPVRHAAPAPPAVAEKRRAAKANVETQPRVGAAKTAAREDRGAKPANEAVETQPRAGGAKTAARENRGAKPANEALNAVRRFQDNLRDIPVSSYAADGTRRTIVIRPTSIQDVYYYSAPR
jgi:hypothetical protein